MGEYAVVKTSVWWDIENCAVPRNCDPHLIVQNMSSALATAGYRGPISISAYGDTHQIAHNVQHALSSTGVSLNHVPAGIKDASDKKILVDMLFWAIDNPPPANYLLISGDRDFSHAIHKLKMRRYNILLAQPPNVSQTLTAAAKSVWLWKSLVAGEPPLEQSPYISSTSCGNKDDLATSKNIVSNSSDVTQDANPVVQNILCDRHSGSNSVADTKYQVKRLREMETDNVSKPASKKQQQKMISLTNTSTKRTASKKSKGDFHTTEQSKFKQPKQGQLKAVKGQGFICYKCGDGHRAAECTFSGDSHGCGRQGHEDRVCKADPNSIVKRQPAHAQDLATSSTGSVSRQVTPDVPSPPPAAPDVSSPPPAAPDVPSPPPAAPDVPSSPSAPPVAPASPQTTAGTPSGPAHSGVYTMPTATEMGRADVAQPLTFCAPRPPMAVPVYQPSLGQSKICVKCGVVGHRCSKCTYIGACQRCGQLGHAERVCRDNPDSIIKWEVCRNNPDSIIKWESVHAHELATSSHGSVDMTAPVSQLHPTGTPPPGCFLQETPAVPTPPPAPAAPVPPHTGVGDFSAPAHSGVYAVPTAVSLGKPDVVTQPASSAPHPPTAVLAHRPMAGPGQYHQVGASWPFPAWTPPPGCFLQVTPAVPTPPPVPAASVPPHTGVGDFSAPAHSGVYAMPTAVSLGKPDMVTQPTSSAPHSPTAVLAHRSVTGQYHQVDASQLQPASSAPRPPMAVLAHRPVAGQYHQVGASQLQPASSAPCPPTAVLVHRPVAGQYYQVGASQLQPASSAPHPPTAVLAQQPGQYHQVSTSQLLPAWTLPPGYFWQAAPVMLSPLLAPLVTSAPSQPGVAASPAPAAHS